MRLCFSFILAAPLDDVTLIEVLAPIRAIVDRCERFVAFSKITPNFYLRWQRVSMNSGHRFLSKTDNRIQLLASRQPMLTAHIVVQF